jgi:hypothetical protein
VHLVIQESFALEDVAALRMKYVVAIVLTVSCLANAFASIGKPWSHYTSIGFSFDSPRRNEDSIQALMRFWKSIAEDSDTVLIPMEEGNNADGCSFLYRRTKSGSEVWSAVTRDGGVLGFEPHFCGSSRVRLEVTSRNEDDTGLEAWLTAKVDGFPLEFSCPNYGLHKKHLKADPSVVDVQLAAFAHEIYVFDSLEAYDKEQLTLPNLNDLCSSGRTEGKKREGLAVASKSFGLASVFDKTKRCYAVFTGHVIKTNKRVNEASGNSFYWALVRTLLDIEFDVVIDPNCLEHFKQCPPQVGGVIQGYFWLSGRIMVAMSNGDSTSSSD